MSDELFEQWRVQRSDGKPPPADFVDRVMSSIGQAPPPSSIDITRKRWPTGVRTGVMAAAFLVALFRAVELLSVFSATGLEN